MLSQVAPCAHSGLCLSSAPSPPLPMGTRLTLVWKLKMVTDRQTRAVMPRQSSTDVVL